MRRKWDSGRKAADDHLGCGRTENITRQQECRIRNHSMAVVYLRQDARYPQKGTRILRYVDVLLKERGGKNIHGRLPEAGSIQLTSRNNWEGRDASGHIMFWSMERWGEGNAGQTARAGIPPCHRKITFHIDDMKKGYSDRSSITYKTGERTWWGRLVETVVTDAIYEVYHLVCWSLYHLYHKITRKNR